MSKYGATISSLALFIARVRCGGRKRMWRSTPQEFVIANSDRVVIGSTDFQRMRSTEFLQGSSANRVLLVLDHIDDP